MAELEEDSDAAILNVQVRSDDAGRPVISLSGDLDISSVDVLRDAVTSAKAGAPEQLTFDMAGLRFMDSAGISVLLGAARDVPGVRLLDPTPPVRRVIELTGLTEVLEVQP